MKRLLILFVVLFNLFFTFFTVAQSLDPVRKNININFPEKIQKIFLDPLPAGTYSVGNGGYFPTIEAAFNKLSNDGIAGEVILELINNTYTAPADTYGIFLNGPIPGAAQDKRVTIKPAANKNVVIEGTGYVALSFLNTSYVTIDGVSLSGPSSLTIHALYNNQFNLNDCIDFWNNSDYNIIQNVTFINDDYTRYSGGPAFWTTWYTDSTADYNLIRNNFIKKSGIGIYVSTYNGVGYNIGNIISGNIIGSETDSIISWGIQIEDCLNAIVENNHIQNIRRNVSYFTVTHGINCFRGEGNIIRNNIIHNIRDNGSPSGATGILLSGDSFRGKNNLIYNNMIYDIHGYTSAGGCAAGINMWAQNYPSVFYNTVYLSGTGACLGGSAALYITATTYQANVKNNVLVNTRDETPQCASAIRSYVGLSQLISDYNDLYYEPNSYNCLVRVSFDYHTLAEWQAMGEDLHSVTEMPHFINPYLHIDPVIPTALEKKGIPIAGFNTDFDGEPRNGGTPDIGADEFDGIVGVKDNEPLPSEFYLGQNYPNPFNPVTTFNYSLPQPSKVIIKLFDILGTEVKILLNEEKPAGNYQFTFNASDLTSGVYFYQINAGQYVSTKKMILIK